MANRWGCARRGIRFSKGKLVTRDITVTIGIPFLNARKTLADAVRSVFAQTFDDWELLLVDDGSSDGSLEIARRIEDPRVRVLADGVNRGLCIRLNQIAAQARGKYHARMDADDLMHPERLARQVRFLESHPEIDLLDSAVVSIDEAGQPRGKRGTGTLDPRPAAVVRQGLLIHPAVMGRTAWFRQNLYDAAYVRAEDRELWCRVCRTARSGRLPEPLLFYREGLPGNLGNYLRSEQTVRKILRAYGPRTVGRVQTAFLVTRSHLKCVVHRAYTCLGQQAALIARRNHSLAPAEAATAREVIGRILSTRIPGLDPTEVAAGARR